MMPADRSPERVRAPLPPTHNQEIITAVMDCAFEERANKAGLGPYPYRAPRVAVLKLAYSSCGYYLRASRPQSTSFHYVVRCWARHPLRWPSGAVPRLSIFLLFSRYWRPFVCLCEFHAFLIYSLSLK